MPFSSVEAPSTDKLSSSNYGQASCRPHFLVKASTRRKTFFEWQASNEMKSFHNQIWDFRSSRLLVFAEPSPRPETKMPTEVYELTPQQLDWLYEHQALKNVDPIHHTDLVLTNTVFNPTPHLSPKFNDLRDIRRDSYVANDSCTASSTSHHSESAESSRPPDPEETEGIIFPFGGERPSWEQSLANLLCHKERHGDCNVPRFYPTHRQLGSWVHRQRLKKKFPHKYGALKKEQLQKLETVGFNWRVRKDNR